MRVCECAADVERILYLHFAAGKLLAFADLDVEVGVLEHGARHSLSPSLSPSRPPPPLLAGEILCKPCPFSAPYIVISAGAHPRGGR